MAELRISDLPAHSTGTLKATDLIEVSEESGGLFTSTKMTGASLNKNFANTDLTFDGDRSHDTDGHNLLITTDAGVGVESVFYMTPTTVLISSLNGVQFGGSITTAYNNYIANHTVTALDNIVDCTTGTFTVTLPTAVGIGGRQYIVKNSGAGTITLEGDGTETIDGSLNVTLAANKCYTVVSNGVNWIITNAF